MLKNLIDKFKKKIRDFIGEDYKDELVHYIVQPLLVLLALFSIFEFLGLMGKEAIVAGLGSSAFVAFCMPKNYTAKARNLIGSHLLSALIGIGFSSLLAQHSLNGVLYFFLVASAVSVSTFAMILTRTEHPPAAGTALGFALGEGSWISFAFIVIATVVLAFMKRTLSDRLIDLI